MAERPVFDGQRQRDALTELQKASGRDATAIAKDVSLSYPQYNRYLWGRLPLRTDQLDAFAAAYGVTKAKLSRALGLLDDDAPDPELRSRVIEAVSEMLDRPVTDDTIDAVTKALGQHGETVQDDLLSQFRKVLVSQRAGRSPA